MLAVHVKILEDEGKTHECAVVETSEFFEKMYPFGAGIGSVEAACKKAKVN